MRAYQLALMQLLKHLLTILAIAQIVVMQDDVIAGLAAQRDCFCPTGGDIDMLCTHLGQHGLHRRAEVAEVVDDQKALVAVDDHDFAIFLPLNAECQFRPLAQVYSEIKEPLLIHSAEWQIGPLACSRPVLNAV